jgi:hypothetical protein
LELQTEGIGGQVQAKSIVNKKAPKKKQEAPATAETPAEPPMSDTGSMEGVEKEAEDEHESGVGILSEKRPQCSRL